MTQSNIAPKASPFWDYFPLESTQPHIALLSAMSLGKNISRGREGATKLKNRGLIALVVIGWTTVKNHTIVVVGQT